MREAVRGVAEHFPTAIVSGRRRDKVHSNSVQACIPLLGRRSYCLSFSFLCLAAFYKYSTCCDFSCVAQYCQLRVLVMLMALCNVQVFNFVKLAELYYAGSHGMDIKGPTARCKHTKANVRNILLTLSRWGKNSYKTPVDCNY
jgi:hypothetical protein